MNAATRRLIPTLALCLAMSIAGGANAFAQDRDKAFKDGMEAYEKKEWARAAELMRVAVKTDSQESPRKVEYGGRLGGLLGGQKATEYLPYYYLGHALFSQQPPNCSGAVDAWARSEEMGVVRKRADLHRKVQDGYVDCKNRGVLQASEFDPLLKQAVQRYNDTLSVMNTVNKAWTDNPDLFREGRPALDQARADMDIAQRRLTSGTDSRLINDLEEARKAIDRARATLTGLETSLRLALEAVKEGESAARAAQQQLEAAGEARTELENSIAAGRGIALPTTVSAARQRANEAYERGRDQYVSGSKTGNKASFDEAVRTLRDAASQFTKLRDEVINFLKVRAEGELLAARTAGAQALKFVQDILVTLDRRMAANPARASEMTPERDKAVAQDTVIRRRLESLLRGDDVPAIQQQTRAMNRLRDVLTELTERFGPLTLRERGVSQALENGAARFLAGEYSEALTQLSPAGGFAADDPLGLHVHLFRAASLYELYAQSRGTKADLRKQALAEIDACKKIDSLFQPDPRVFSPRFLALYRDGSDTVVAARSQPR